MRISDYQKISTLSGDDVFLVETANGTKTIKVSDLVNALPNGDVAEVLFREVKASRGFFGIEQDLDELMSWVKAGQWDKFAIGDYFIEVTSDGEKIQWEVADKNPYKKCGSHAVGANHIYCIPRDCLETNHIVSSGATNDGGYPASLLPTKLENLASKFSKNFKEYMLGVYRLEDCKNSWLWKKRNIWLPTVVEVAGWGSFANGYTGTPVSRSLALYTGGSAHLTKGRGFNSQVYPRASYWLSSVDSTSNNKFCFIGGSGDCATGGINEDRSLAPAVILCPKGYTLP